jgi:hypothetical protein
MKKVPNVNKSFLSSSTTVARYLELEAREDVHGIVRFVQERFEERYIKPFEDNSKKNGFIMMAASCLMIEALESFKHGWRRSPNSARAFHEFFRGNSHFDEMRNLSQEFYTHVRCGIMHQGETTGGWHVRRNLRKLFDGRTRTIDATVFLKQMKGAVSDYCATLEMAAWNSKVWRNFRKKMKDVCTNTQRKA